LLACTRHLLETYGQEADPGPLGELAQSRWQSLTELALTEVAFDDLQLEGQIAQFAKLTATLRQVPSTRQRFASR
jgi:hypothetical protein